ncbi:DTW domain-containing protein [Striga asiatica]|uniref:DTW domain-containing protein n=1 Tax=Striga asiatica TaxID=4170 RepID=A0A5A7NZA0_STRAF|nr:DTW domain-containing protein [Striga asiatica]
MYQDVTKRVTLQDQNFKASPMESPVEPIGDHPGDGGPRVPWMRLCASATPPPLQLRYPRPRKIILLHHPHERRRKLAAVPILSKCLRHCKTSIESYQFYS